VSNDVGPGSGYERGYIKPAGELEMHPEEERDYERNLMYGKVPEVITRGSVTSPKREEVGRGTPTSRMCSFGQVFGEFDQVLLP
jgi:hypothetical protein